MLRPLVLLIVFSGLVAAGADWLTDAGSPQRNNWQKDEKILAVNTVKDMKLLWKLHLDNEPRQMHSLFPPLIVDYALAANGADKSEAFR